MGANASAARSEGYDFGSAAPDYTPSQLESWYTASSRRKSKKGNLLGRSNSVGTNGYFSPTTGVYTSQFGALNGYPQPMQYAYPSTYTGMPVIPVIPGTAVPTQAQTQPQTAGLAQFSVPMPTAPVPTPISQQREIPVAPTIFPIPNVTPVGDMSASSDATAESQNTESSGSSSATTPNNPGAEGTSRAPHGPLANNPLPAPPRESSIPEHLISGTAMTQHTPNIPHSPRLGQQQSLDHPLPPLPVDVYDTPEYRILTMGTGYHHEIHPARIYPEGWFDKEKEGRGERRKERERWRHKADSVMDSSSSGMLLGASLTRRLTKTMKRFARVGGGSFRRGRGNSAPMPFPAPFPGSPGTSYLYSAGLPTVPSTTQTMMAAAQPVIPGVTAPMTHFRGPLQGGAMTPGVQMPEAQRAGPAADGTLSSSTSTSTSPISPTVQIHRPPPLQFDSTSPFALPSPHTVLYKKKLYSSALHLLEAHKFLGVRNDLAERVRQARTVEELRSLAPEIEPYKRRDWEGIVMNRVEEVLYLKFVQHPELRRWLYDTGISDLIFAEPMDAFWGTGPTGQGANELGKALGRVRDRLRREGSGR